MLEDCLRLGGAIACEALALIIWNLGSRSPRRLLSDARIVFGSGRRLFGAAIVTLLGFIFFSTSIVLIVPILVDPRSEFSPIVIGTVLVALFVDLLIGTEVRSLVFTRRES